MHAKINQALLTTTARGPRDLMIVDEILPGFELRVRPTGTKIWYYRYRATDGRQRRLVLGRYPGIGAAEARQRAVAAAGDVARGVDLLARKRQIRVEHVRAAQSTLKYFLDKRYEPWAKTHLKTATFQLERIRVDFKSWLDRPITELTTDLVDDWRRRTRATGKEPVTINRELQRLHAAIGKAVEWKIIERHPFTGIKPLRFDRTGIVRYLSEVEEIRLRKALLDREEKLRKERKDFNLWLRIRGREEFPERTGKYCDHLQPLVMLALNTGLRRGELFALLWKDVDLKAKWLTVAGAHAKNGQTRRIPLNVEAVEVLSTWQDIASNSEEHAQVFPGVGGENLTTINTSWRTLRSAAGLEDFRFHDLRHHFASRLVQSGIDLNTVRELLGHADISMVLRYAHLSPERLIMAVEHVARSATDMSPKSHNHRTRRHRRIGGPLKNPLTS